MTIDQSFFARSALEVARELIGVELTFKGVGGIIVETEAYLPDDPASHSYIGQRPRNMSMWAGPGSAYVYLIYGVHYCLNIACLPGSAVLIRALEPRSGISLMHRRRKLKDIKMLCSGPGKLAQALSINRKHDGMTIVEKPFSVVAPTAPHTIITGPRIGITKATHQPWRFGLQDSRFLSQKF
jgi:DNA-3-methyladenine glycosylase